MKRLVVSEQHETTPKVLTYIIGFVLSVVLTFAAYLLVVHQMFSATTVLLVIAALAVVQFTVQMVFFLHLGQESRPRWRLVAMLFMAVVVLILVYGSVWIMDNLNYNMRMTPEQEKTYLHNNEGL